MYDKDQMLPKNFPKLQGENRYYKYPIRKILSNMVKMYILEGEKEISPQFWISLYKKDATCCYCSKCFKIKLSTFFNQKYSVCMCSSLVFYSS